jgi:lipoprotein-anchoring transpeptidase ErfK/SrfK
MEAPSIGRRVALSALALALFAVAATLAAAVLVDYTQRSVVPAGVRVDGQDLSGLTAVEARAMIDANVAEPLLQPLTATFRDRVDGMLSDALAPRTSAPLAKRLYLAASGASVGVSVKPKLAVDDKRLGAWVDAVASSIDTRPVDALLTADSGKLVVVPSAAGYQTERNEAMATVRAALMTGEKAVPVPTKEIAPKITEEDFGRTIVVDISERRLYLYNKASVEKTYRVAVGTPGYPTPKGHFEIVQKRYRPTWSNPGSAWAKSMPKSIPPGPGNPLGTRALNLNASGIRIHGTNKISSIGTAASHGCMRMVRHDIEELYELVDVGTQVFIVK